MGDDAGFHRPRAAGASGSPATREAERLQAYTYLLTIHREAKPRVNMGPVPRAAGGRTVEPSGRPPGGAVVDDAGR